MLACSRVSREICQRYCDPIDEIWLATARRLGIEVRRSDAAYAAYDGLGVLTIAEPGQLDGDDSLAQLILHELCHALVAGSGALGRRDWGLENVDGRDLVLEHACHRLQAALSGRYGLRAFFAVTTDHRPYWDALPSDPIAAGDDPAIAVAQRAWRDAQHEPWKSALTAAFEATASVAGAVRPFVGEVSLWHGTKALHASGFPVGSDATKSCGDCAWLIRAGGHAVARCRQTRRAGQTTARRVRASDRSCERFEPGFVGDACASCGACCRQGFDLVPVRPRDTILKQRPDLVHRDRHGPHLPRPQGRCVALEGNGAEREPYRCTVYGIRPKSCAEFAVGGDACLQARRRVGLSR